MYNNNTSNNDNNDIIIIDNSKLFFKIWRNIVIKKEIIKYCKVYYLINQDKPKFKSTKHIHDKYYKKHYDKELCLDSMKPIIDGYEIPNTITSLDFSSKFNQDLTPSSIPSSVKTLRMGSSFNKLLKSGDIPNSVETLFFGDRFSNGLFNQPLQNSIPSSVTDLSIYSIRFNQKFKPGDFPSSIKTLKFRKSKAFHEFPENVIPSSTTSLTLDKVSNNIMNSIPQINSITYLEIGESFSFPRPLSKLKQLETLKFLYIYGGQENSFVIECGDIPNSVTELELPYGFKTPISYGVLPMGLKSLKLGGEWNQPIWDTVNSVSILPPSITRLEFGLYWNQELDEHYLPPNLTELIFSFYFNKPIINERVLPKSIKSITFGYLWNKSSEFIILPNLKKLSFNPVHDNGLNSSYKPFQNNVIPLHLVLNEYRNVPLSRGNIFPNVTTLDFGDFYNQKLTEGLFPITITTIKFGRDFNKPILPNVLPATLTSLSFGVKFNRLLDSSNLPQSLLKLTIYPCYNHSLKPLKSFSNLRIYRNNNILKGRIYEINND